LELNGGGKYELSEIVYCPRDKVDTSSEDVQQDIPGWRIKPSLFCPEKERYTISNTYFQYCS
jgi:hypothetical protein